MPQIEFDGLGTPIPTIALPPFGSDGNLPPTTLTFYVDDEFAVSQYRDLGFTHYEAWCVGGAGGRGGDVSNDLMYIIQVERRAVPGDVWALRLELVRLYDYQLTGVWDMMHPLGVPGPRGDYIGTMVENEEYQNPGHLLTFNTYKQILLYPTAQAMGGAGGGGGFQKSSGLLADLDDLVSIKVGQAGGDQPYGQTTVNGIWVPLMDLPYTDPASQPYPGSRIAEINNYFSTYLNVYPGAHSSYFPPLAGGDGGYSSFGEVCKASGGKGGHPGKVWNGSAFVINGEGGAGGIGNSIVAGGGGAGSTAEGINGEDGSWHPETGIGAGGGGGKGGLPSTFDGPYDPRFPTPPVIQHLATAGGQGSYSFGDTSVYGARQFRQPWTYLKPVPGYYTSGGPTDGTVTYVSTTVSTALVVPGGGGGARPNGSLKAGSKATGYSPNGVVLLRLTRIT